MSWHISYTIGYTSLHSDSTTLPFTHHIRWTSLELYVHRIKSSVSGHCFVLHNELLWPSFNIGTDSQILFTKSLYTLSSMLQEFLGKVFFLFSVQFHTVVILVWNKWFVWIHNIESLERQYLVVVILGLYLPSSRSNNFTFALMSSQSCLIYSV